MVEYQTASLQSIVAGANTGDIVLFAGTGFFSSFIRLFSNVRDWSHVGMVIRFKHADDVPPQFAHIRERIERTGADVVCLFESTYANPAVHDLVWPAHKNGPQLTLLQESLEHYHGRSIGIRPLYVRGGRHADDELRRLTACCGDFAATCYPAGYDLNPAHWFRTAFRIRAAQHSTAPMIREGADGYYCTALLVATFIACGIMPPDRGPRYFNLYDFDLNGYLPLTEAYSYGETRFLTGLK